MKTNIDSEILEDFFSSKPQPIPFGDTNENNCWNSFWTFIQSETDLSILNHTESYNFNSPYFQFYNAMTSGRGNTEITFNKFSKPFKCEFPIDNPHTFHCVSEEDEKEKLKYRRKNGLLIAFKDDYKKYWSDLKLLNKDKEVPVRKNYRGKIFKSWEELGNYLLPFTDVVLADNYLLSDDPSVESNLKPILLQLDKATQITYNLTIITSEGTRCNLDSTREFEKLISFKRENQLKCDLSLVINKGYDLKEHDRGIFMNYLRIYSGDSFNYFNSKNEIMTKGTDIQFKSMASPESFNTANAALENLSAIVKKMKERFPTTNTFGALKNRLLKIGML